jgi:hypothetical protein
MSPPSRHRSPPALPSRTLAIDQALAGSEPLAQLARRMRASQDRLTAITPLLPPAMRASVRAGPIDDAGWSVLTSSNAVAAKLRQMLPALEAHLRAQGWDGPPLRVKLLSTG